MLSGVEAQDDVFNKHKYSVLLLYPDSATDGAIQTYYTFVEAISVHEAELQALLDCGHSDASVLLVTLGHNKDVR